MLSDDDKLALATLLARYARLFSGIHEDQKRKVEIDAAISAKHEQLGKLHSAFEVFGFQTREGGFKLMRTAIGDDAYDEALLRGGIVSAHVPASAKSEAQSIVDEIERPTVREGTLSQLRNASGKPLKAAEIRSFLEKTYEMSLHEKTVGMTLYRLSLDGLARREGHNWFFVNSETKNPGGETPGLMKSGN